MPPTFDVFGVCLLLRRSCAFFKSSTCRRRRSSLSPCSEEGGSGGPGGGPLAVNGSGVAERRLDRPKQRDRGLFDKDRRAHRVQAEVFVRMVGHIYSMSRPGEGNGR